MCVCVKSFDGVQQREQPKEQQHAEREREREDSKIDSIQSLTSFEKLAFQILKIDLFESEIRDKN